jgi:hypothetical protein
MVGHRCNASYQDPKDGGGLTWFATYRRKHLMENESRG